MTLSRSEISDGLVEELRAFEQLIRPLSQTELDSPSRCAGWTVGDVARHVIGSMADVTAGRLDGLGTPEVTAREVAERSDRTAAQLADECSDVATAAAALLQIFDDTSWNAPTGGYDGTVGEGVEALWYDTWLHGDDIRNALGRPSELGTTALDCALAHVGLALSKRDWTGDVPSSTDPRALAFVLAATGRGGAETFGSNAPIDIYA